MNQNTTPNNRRLEKSPETELITLSPDAPDSLAVWAEGYFRFEVTTSERSQKEQKRDLKTFLEFMWKEEGTDERTAWSPRLSRAFVDYLKATTVDKEGEPRRRWSDRTINRMVAHLKTFGKWVHKLRQFPLGNPMEKVKGLKLTSSLEIERALTPSERRRILDAADLLVTVGGLSRDRRRNKSGQRGRRKGYRPYRNRAIIYILIETGMRRGAVARANVAGLDLEKRTITVEEKGGAEHTYHISKEGARAIADYLEYKRGDDSRSWKKCVALFLTSPTVAGGTGRLNVKTVNNVWDEVCRLAEVEGKTPHAARHAMGKHIIDKTGNIAAVQRQLGHKNAAYSMQYARVSGDELKGVLDAR